MSSRRPRFAKLVAKRLRSVEVDPKTSNQHEFNGVVALKDLLGDQRFDRRPAQFTFLGGEEPVEDHGFVTWYDSRADNPKRSEWRLYFNANSVLEAASEDDLLVVLEPVDDAVEFFVAAAGSSEELQLRWLLDLGEVDQTVRLFEPGRLKSRLTEAGLTDLLDALRLDPPDDDFDLDHMLERFPGGLPTTRVFSEYARSLVDKDIVESPDEAIERWMATEEMVFRAFERHLLADRLQLGFWNEAEGAPDVDGFTSFALSILNRRKARAGQALEHHLQALLDHRGIVYERGATTEGSKKPDFLFPGSDIYERARSDSSMLPQLRMLGVKTSCKDRWRQVLSEADLIPRKHLLTLEAPISLAQTSEMHEAGLTLIIPAGRHERFESHQTAKLLRVGEFFKDVSKGN